jgi:hypothetical protein
MKDAQGIPKYLGITSGLAMRGCVIKIRYDI